MEQSIEHLIEVHLWSSTLDLVSLLFDLLKEVVEQVLIILIQIRVVSSLNGLLLNRQHDHIIIANTKLRQSLTKFRHFLVFVEQYLL